VRVRVPPASLRMRVLILGITASLSVLLLVAPPGFGQASRYAGGREPPTAAAGRQSSSPAVRAGPDTAPPRSSTSVHGVAALRPSGTPHASASATPSRTPTLGPGPIPVPTSSASSAFVGRSGTQLTLGGQPYRFTGINIYMAASGGTPSSCGGELYPDVSVPLSNMPHGIVVRFWAFQNFFVSGGAFNWTNFDSVLSIAASYGDKVIPVLANQWNYCDGPAKDLAWYQSGYNTTVASGDIVTYRQYVADVVARYANNPTIATWQLVNEGQAINDDGTCTEATALSALLAFSNNVGGLVHNIDHNHLVSEGTLAGWNGGIGQFCGAANGDYQTLMASPGTDVCDFHDYGYPGDPMGDPLAPHLASAIQMCHADDKPIMVAETGIYATSDADLAGRATDFKAKFVAQFQAGVVGELMWCWAVKPDYVTPAADPDYGIFPGDPSLAVLGTI
jgi:mannan endo-1,4-beta-mannosidase